VRTPISSLTKDEENPWVQAEKSLFLGVYSVFLWRDQVEQGLGAAIELVKLSVVRRLKRSATAVLIEYGEQKGAMMKSTVLNGVV
jgi:hypothetical protein